MKDKLVSYNDIRQWHPIFRRKYGDTLIRLGVKISGLNNVNEIYDRSKHLIGPDFCKDVLDKLHIKRTVRNIEVLNKFTDKPFITVSNHPYGHIDGIAAIETVGSKVKNYRLLVNSILGIIDTMSENFITVTPHGKDTMGSITLNGLKECISHVNDGLPLGFFPAGAVSNLEFKKGKFRIRDREWQSSIIKLIQRSKVPVIPMHISGNNSFSFYASKILGWQFRTSRLCHELYNKKGKEMIMTLGNPIYPEEMTKYNDIKQLGEFLKTTTYKLAE